MLAELAGHDPDALKALTLALDADVPPGALAMHARWWQLEDWLRHVVYLEFGSRDGRSWQSTPTRNGRSAERRAGPRPAPPEADRAVDELDFDGLVTLIDGDWPLFETDLMARLPWADLVKELTPIRHRIVQFVPPADDDAFLVQRAMRYLSSGARQALRPLWQPAASDLWTGLQPGPGLPDDPVVTRLAGDVGRVEGVARSWHTRFSMHAVRRPWARAYARRRISGTPGWLYQAVWDIEPSFDPAEFWRQHVYAGGTYAGRVLYAVYLTGRLTVFLPAVDDPERVMASLGSCFASVIRAIRAAGHGEIAFARHDAEREACRQASRLPGRRMHAAGSLLSRSARGIVHDDYSIFSTES